MIIVAGTGVPPVVEPEVPQFPEGYQGYAVGTPTGLWPLTLDPVVFAPLKLDAVDEQYVEWTATSFDGRGSSSPKGEMAENPSDHGSVALGPWNRQPDQFTIAGSAVCGTPRIRFEAEERLRAIVARPELLLIRHDEVPRQQGVRLYGKLNLPRSSPTVFEFEIPLIALDPRLYSTEVRTLEPITSSAVTPLHVPHAVPHQVSASTIIRSAVTVGTETAWPRWTLTGPMVNPAITNAETGESLRFDLTLYDGQQLVVDTHPSARTVLLNGDPTLSRRGSTYGQWWGFTPGTNQVLFTSSAPSAGIDQFAAAWRDTWL